MKISFLNFWIGLLSVGSCSDSGNSSVDKTSSDVGSNGTQTASTSGSAGPSSASSTEATGVTTSGPSSSSVGFVGTTDGSSGGTMTSGVTTSGTVDGGGGSGNAGAGLAPEELREATYDECALACATEHEACPTIAQENCFGSCSSQADGAFTSGHCGLELYQALFCINRDLEISDITCPSTPGGAPMFAGCSGEQVRYADCS